MKLASFSAGVHFWISQFLSRMQSPALFPLLHSHNKGMKLHTHTHTLRQRMEYGKLMWQWWDLLHLNYSKVSEQFWTRKWESEWTSAKGKEAGKMKNKGRGGREQGAIFHSHLVQWENVLFVNSVKIIVRRERSTSTHQVLHQRFSCRRSEKGIKKREKKTEPI